MKKAQVEYRQGPGIIVGDTGKAGQQLVLLDPWGNRQEVTSGSKAEYGAGGFEFLAAAAAIYTLTVNSVPWQFDHRGRVTVVRFTEQVIVPMEPGPALEPSPAPILSDSQFAAVMATLDRIEALLKARLGG